MSSVSEFYIVDLSQCPNVIPMETPLTPPKRKRNWSPPAASRRSVTPPSPRTPRARRGRGRGGRAAKVNETRTLLNYGSEPESESDSDEDGVGTIAPAIPRVLQVFMESTEDDEEPSALQPSSPLLWVPSDVTLLTLADATPLSPADATPSSPADATPSSPADATPSWSGDATPPSPADATPRSCTPLPVEPNDFLDFKWSSFPDPPVPSDLRRESFSKSNAGPTVPHADPYDIFMHMWDRQFMEHIASETNKYAQQLVTQLMERQSLRPSSRICEWKDTTVDELYVFFAMIVAMGVVAKGRLVDYWSASASIFMTPGFHVYMSLRRFQLLCKCLHFNDNNGMNSLNLDRSEAKLFKIQPLIDHLNSVFQSSYNLQQNIALDESLLQWKGWLDINQFIPNKTAAVGIKTYEICDSQTGYLWRFIIHAHKRTETAAPSDPLQAFIPSLVLELLQGLENKGHTVWMDNFYNSPALARKLKSLRFDCVGTLRTNRQLVPRQLTNLSKQNMRQGEIAGMTSGDVDLMVWRDRNVVGMISTYHGIGIVKTRGDPKPALIHDYNIMMGGVDKKDQMLAAFPIERKRTRVWYKKFFRRLLNVSILNCYVIGKFNKSNLPHRAFRVSLVDSILKHHSPHVAAVPAALPQAKGTKPTIQEHHLIELDFDSSLKSRKRRQCVACKKRVTTACSGCGKAACMNPCFVSIH